MWWCDCGGATVVVRVPTVRVRDPEAAVRTTRYNDTGVPTHHIIRSNEPALSTKKTMFALQQVLVHKKYA
jgi:hypothetical protein